MTMPQSVRAGLAALCVLICVAPCARGAESGGWLTDPAASCAVYAAGGGDRVAWTGACEDGLATGLGTATFFKGDEELESFTADFVRGMAADGHVITRWGQGASYDGDSAHGRFNGGGVLTTDRQDRYLGLWTDGKMNGFGLLERADGSGYAGEWKNDLPNGQGELRRPDGSVVSGMFADGRLVQGPAAAALAHAAPAGSRAVKTASAPAPENPPGMVAALTPVTVKDSQLHTIDDGAPPAADAAAPPVKPDGSDPSKCLKVDSDGLNWGFRNGCDFPLQFAYCMPQAGGLAACANGGAPGSVAAGGFGALMADKSLGEAGVEHSFRWIACAGGAGEVIAHLEKADPPSGRCERADSGVGATLAAVH